MTLSERKAQFAAEFAAWLKQAGLCPQIEAFGLTVEQGKDLKAKVRAQQTKKRGTT